MIRSDLFENNYLFSRFSVNQVHKKYTHALYNVVDMYNENISLYTKFKSLFEKHMVKYFYLLMEALEYNSCECAKRNSVFINHDMDNNLDTIRPEIYASDYSIYYKSKLTNTKSDYVKVYGIDKFVALYVVPK